MFELFARYLKTKAHLSDDEIEQVRVHTIAKKVRKRQYFLLEGEICKYSGFTVKGAMRQYSVGDEGKEHVINLYLENWWVSDLESLPMLTPSAYNIDAWEDTELLTITKAESFML